MMEIKTEDISKETTTFGELPKGQPFLFCGDPLIKISDARAFDHNASQIFMIKPQTQCHKVGAITICS